MPAAAKKRSAVNAESVEGSNVTSLTVGAATPLVIEPPNFGLATIRLRGVAPYVQHKFSQKARAMMEAKHRAGSQAKKGKQREARDFESDYEAAMHISREGWCGIPAPSFRNAAISACRVVGFQMTRAKLSVFVLADGYDKDDGTPLVRIYGEPRRHEAIVRNDTGVVDIRWRPMWEQWYADIRVRWDQGQFSAADIINLFARAGLQVGVGEGRPDSPDSNGMGWGLWEID